jgi:predicted DNA binding CopG/RHH family protein
MSKAKEYALKKNYKVDEEMTREFERKLRLSKKKSVTIRLPEEVINAFKKMSGEDGKYQALMREVLIEAAKKEAS